MNRVGDLNLWAIGYGDAAEAKAARGELMRVQNLYGLHLLDTVVVTSRQDGTFATEHGETTTLTKGMLGFGVLGALVGAVVLQPLAGAAVAAAIGGLAASIGKSGIDDAFIDEVKKFMKPGTATLFALTRTDNPEAVVREIHGLGGTVLHTNVDPELARQVQEAIGASRLAP